MLLFFSGFYPIFALPIDDILIFGSFFLPHVMKPRPPAINAPRIILILIIIMSGVHILRSVATAELARDLLLYLSLIPARYSETVLLPGGGSVKFLSFITYSFLHGDITHLVINMLTMLAFGSIAAWRLGTLRFLILCAVCSIAGGLVHLFSHWGEPVPVIGASAIVSGHMAVAARFLDGQNSFFLARGVNVQSLQPMGALDILKSRTAMVFLCVWFGINLFIGLGGNALGDGFGRIAWEAHIGGFLAGFIFFPGLDKRRRDSL